LGFEFVKSEWDGKQSPPPIKVNGKDFREMHLLGTLLRRTFSTALRPSRRR
jgi:hypothetical protein